MEWGLIGWFEFTVVTTCLFSKAYGRNIDLWKAIQSPMEAEDIVRVASGILWWIAILCVYLIFRIEFLTVAALIGSMIVFLGLFMFFLSASVLLSWAVYSGIWENQREAFLCWAYLRSHEIADQLRTIRARNGKF